MDYREYSKDG